MADISEKIADVHIRLGRLEQAVSAQREVKKDSAKENAIEFFSATLALGFCFLGLGVPTHYYQYVFAVLIVAVLYHKQIFPYPEHWHEWILMGVNVLVVSMLLKLVIGGGEPQPFHWISYPTIEGGLTSFKISWQQTSVAEWKLQLTVIQTFFLVLTLFGTLIGFDLFVGLTSLILVLLAVPALVSFNWDWALPGMIAALFSFYLQGDEVS